MNREDGVLHEVCKITPMEVILSYTAFVERAESFGLSPTVAEGMLMSLILILSHVSVWGVLDSHIIIVLMPVKRERSRYHAYGNESLVCFQNCQYISNARRGTTLLDFHNEYPRVEIE